jgi:hypothetical protein
MLHMSNTNVFVTAVCYNFCVIMNFNYISKYISNSSYALNSGMEDKLMK